MVTMMFGAGVLGLPYALASLGWVLGILMLALATGASFYSAILLADVSGDDMMPKRQELAAGQEPCGHCWTAAHAAHDLKLHMRQTGG